MKRIQVWNPRNENVGFFLHPEFWSFQTRKFFAHFYLTFSRQITAFVVHGVQPFLSLFEKDVYLTLF